MRTWESRMIKRTRKKLKINICRHFSVLTVFTVTVDLTIFPQKITVSLFRHSQLWNGCILFDRITISSNFPHGSLFYDFNLCRSHRRGFDAPSAPPHESRVVNVDIDDRGLMAQRMISFLTLLALQQDQRSQFRAVTDLRFYISQMSQFICKLSTRRLSTAISHTTTRFCD